MVTVSTAMFQVPSDKEAMDILKRGDLDCCSSGFPSQAYSEDVPRLEGVKGAASEAFGMSQVGFCQGQKLGDSA